MIDPEPPASPFGTWYACADGWAHYTHAGRYLCGSAALRTGLPVMRAGARDRAVVPHCPKCRDLNMKRWGALGGRPV